MIGFLRGNLALKKTPSLILDVQGVGYELEAPLSTFFKLPNVGETVMLYTHLAVREDAHSLYGFYTEAERALFRSLIKVSGVGAKLALAILSGMSAEDFQHCIHHNDLATLIKLPGIGKKTAERLVIEMRDRLPSVESTAKPGSQAVEEAVSAMISLGFKPQEAASLVKGIADQEKKSSEELIRLALQASAK